ncbi:MAG: HNH endonuclease [Phycisphaerales bacterium]
MNTRKLRNNAGFSSRDVLVRYLMERDGHMCAACRIPLWVQEMTVDHVKPLSKGGADVVWNMQLLCEQCHTMKDHPERIR